MIFGIIGSRTPPDNGGGALRHGLFICRALAHHAMGALGLLLLIAPAAAWERPVLPLDGAWQFAADPADKGENEQWFLADRALPAVALPGSAHAAGGRIQAPGCWDAQGYGPATDKLRHEFNGTGWYQKRGVIPAHWAGQRLFLRVGGVMRAAKTWVNGVFLGGHTGYLSGFEFDITDRVVPGRAATITIAVDSRRHADVDPLMGCGTFVDYMGNGYGKDAGYGSTSEATWGGIWGHVTLEARNPVWLGEVFVEPRLSPPGCRVSAVVGGAAGLADAAQVQVWDHGTLLASKTFPLREVFDGTNLTITADKIGDIPGVRWWSFREPHLCTVGLALFQGGRLMDEVKTSAGFREIKTSGAHFLLNGQRIFLNGYGDDAIYPETIAWPVDKDFYRKRLAVIKSYGFNYVRLHSHFLPDEFYAACDEMGLLVQVEAPLAYGYRATTQAARQVYLREWRDCVERYRNHPSIVTWCGGNEGSGSAELGSEFQKIARQLGGNRLFIATDGAEVQGGLRDFFAKQFDVFQLPLDLPNKFDFTAEPEKPIVTHEEGNYVTFPRFGDIARFERASDVKPFWLTAGRERYARLGLLAEAPRLARNSESLYCLLHKLNVESLRLNPRIAGDDWWLFQDYWTTDNGLVDAFFRPKSIKPAEVLQFNNDVVLLQDGLQRTYRSGEELACRLLLSNYGEQDLPAPRVTWRLKLEGKTLAAQDLHAASAQVGALVDAGGVKCSLPPVTRPCQLVLEAEMRLGPRRIDNHWNTWLYPAQVAPPRLDRPLYADKASLTDFARLGAQPIPAGSPKPREAIYVCSRLWQPALDAVKEGATLLLLSPPDGLPSENARYKLPWWRPFREGNTVDEGTVVYDTPALRAIAPAGWCEAQWYELIDGARGMLLDALPERPPVLIRCIQAPIDARDMAFLLAARAGRGLIVISGLNHQRARGLPINDWLLARLVEWAASRPAIKVSLPSNCLKPAAPEASGFDGFDEVIQPGENATWQSHREDNVAGFFCRETSPANVVQWKTEPLPRDWRGQTATFVFAGGLGYSNEPDAGGFVLSVNGAEVLDFNLSFEPVRWQNADGKVTLRFEPKRRLPLDALGLFSLTLPKTLLQPGQACRVGGRSKGAGSRRWFALYPYKDVGDRDP